MTDEQKRIKEQKRLLADLLFNEIRDRTPGGDGVARSRELDQDAIKQKKAIRNWLKEQGRFELVALQTVQGFPLTSTARPSPTSRPVDLAVAIRGSLSESWAEQSADALLAGVKKGICPEKGISPDQYTLLQRYAAALLLEFLPFDWPLELILESVPSIRIILDKLDSFSDKAEVQQRADLVQKYCRRRARAKLSIRTTDKTKNLKLVLALEELVGQGEQPSTISDTIWNFIRLLLEFLKSLGTGDA